MNQVFLVETYELRQDLWGFYDRQITRQRMTQSEIDQWCSWHDDNDYIIVFGTEAKLVRGVHKHE